MSVSDNENWLLVSKNSARWGFLVLVSNRKTILDPREEKIWTTLIYVVFVRSYKIEMKFSEKDCNVI
jgi:hypothetical protein